MLHTISFILGDAKHSVLNQKYPYNEVYSISGMKCALFSINNKFGQKTDKREDLHEYAT